MAERLGRLIFAWAIIAIGAESIICLRTSVAGTHVLPIMPYPPAIPILAVLFGIVMIASGILMIRARTTPIGAMLFAALYLLAALVFDIPRAIGHPDDITLRTLAFQPLSLGALAWMLPEARRPNDWIMTVARYIIAISLIVYGVDHFLALAGIASLVPDWMPFHKFWVGFFGVAFIAAGVSFATNLLRGWAAAGMALMFAVFLVTLHIPRTLGAYNVPGAIRDPDEWCSIFIVAAFCGGFLALATPQTRAALHETGR